MHSMTYRNQAQPLKLPESKNYLSFSQGQAYTWTVENIKQEYSNWYLGLSKDI